MTEGAVAVVPARWGSTRFPGKALADLHGKPMIVRVLERVAQCRAVSRVIAATDDDRILDAARAAGIDVPTLCWYPQLSNVGNCRICLVSVDGTGKLLPSCATPADQGMVVHTESQAAVKNRQGVLSLLLERYPVEAIPADRGRNEFE